jgi:ABC-type molybdenum transport system ATPase subunit/photorepair protein PhrA
LSIGAGTLFDRDRSSQLDSANIENHSTNSVIDVESFTTVLHWLGLINDNSSTNPFLTRSFGTLSQGQQKLLLIASAIAQKPSLLILDEPCQGLDLWNRAKVLHLLHSMCCVTDMSLIYITHHEEELIPSIEHRIRLEDGKVVYCGAFDSSAIK